MIELKNSQYVIKCLPYTTRFILIRTDCIWSLQCCPVCLFCTGESYWCVNLPLLACHYQDGLISTGRKSQRFCEKEIIRFLDIEWSCSWCDMLSCSLISLVISDNFTGGTDWFQPSQWPSLLSLTTDLNKIYTTFSDAVTSLESKCLNILAKLKVVRCHALFHLESFFFGKRKLVRSLVRCIH